MWGGNGRENASPDRYGHANSNGANGESPSEAAAAALAARLAFANAYDSAPTAPQHPVASASAFYDVYGSPPGGQAEDAAALYAQRARELELLHLQQQMEERQAIENEARNRLLEHAARTQVEEYERTRMQLELMAEMQRRDGQARLGVEAERGRLVESHSNAGAIDAAAAQNLSQQHIAEILAKREGSPGLGLTAASRSLEANGNDDRDSKVPAKSKSNGGKNGGGGNSGKGPSSKGVKSPNKAVAKKASSNKAASKKSPPSKGSPETKSSPKKDASKKNTSKRGTPQKSSSVDASTKAGAQKVDHLPNTVSTSDDPTNEQLAKKAPPKKSTPKKEPPQKKKSPPVEGKGPTANGEPAKGDAEGGFLEAPVGTSSSSQADVADGKPAPVPSAPAASPKKRKTPSKSTGASSAASSGGGGRAKRARKSPGGGGGVNSRKASTAPTYNSLIKRKPGTPSMDDAVVPITDFQYENVEVLMGQFCKVPLLAEFSRPVSLLHPELVTLYSKAIHHPMDLGHVCRAIRRREYKSTRAIQLDVWRVFSNCIKFHMHPNARENAIPSFISIAMHLRDYFNSLWHEYMMPSDAPPRSPGKGISHLHSMFQKRAEARKERLLQTAQTVLTPKCIRGLIGSLVSFISSGGKVDKLDRDAILGDPESATGDIATFIGSLQGVIKSLEASVEAGQEYTVLQLHRDLKKCYTEDVFEHEILKKMKITQRLERILGKTLVPIQEVSGRGVNQSSIWGCMAAAIWARENKKKPYWPAIVLGIMAPEDQKEDWHQMLTDRNEGRLPEKLRDDLKAAKRRAELGLRKRVSDAQSYFLVEFMGSHEFIWVKESDIIENFDPEEDVNVAAAAGNITKKRRSTTFNTQSMTNAIEEGRWALEEFEIQLNNTCGDRSDDEDEFNDAGYTYSVLCQSDDEADGMNLVSGKGNESDIDEQNELLGSEGRLDFSAEGRKKAKARVLSMKKAKKQQALKEKEQEKERAKKDKASPKVDSKKILERKREERELEARRKKRCRDHEKLLKDLERKTKKTKGGAAEKKPNPNEVPDKGGRAKAIANGFLLRKCIKDKEFTGASYQPTISVEPSGLLGMALAFRAAAGEIPFADNGEPFVKNSWDRIDADSPSDPTERCKCLQEQIDLVSKEIELVDASTQRRLALTDDAEKARLALQKGIFEKDDEVRSSFKKKKSKAAAKKSDPPTGKDSANEVPDAVSSADVSNEQKIDKNPKKDEPDSNGVSKEVAKAATSVA